MKRLPLLLLILHQWNTSTEAFVNQLQLQPNLLDGHHNKHHYNSVQKYQRTKPLEAKDPRNSNSDNKKTKPRSDDNYKQKNAPKSESQPQQEKTVVILYYKPKDVITSHSNKDSVSSTSNELERRTVYEDIMSMNGYTSPTNNTSALLETGTSFGEVTGIKSKLHAIGRLDAETTGLLLLTNDGGLVHHVTNPTASSTHEKVVKTYDALIMGYHTLGIQEETSKQLRLILEGVDIGTKYGGMTLPPVDLQVLDHPSPKSTLVRIAISEGKNRQVRRMFHAINSGVMRLHRRQVGDIDLNMLNGGGEGSWRVLTKKEVLDGLGWKVRRLDQALDQRPSKKGDGASTQNRRRSRR